MWKVISRATVFIMVVSLALVISCKKEGGKYPDTVVATIPVGDYPWGVVALPNGNYVYVTNYRSDNVSVIGR